MFKLLFTIFLIMHVLGDFYSQSDDLSKKKKEEYKYVVKHSFIYLLVSCGCAILFWSVPLLVSSAFLAVLHFAVYSVKFIYTKGKEANSMVFAVDQLTHICFITVAAAILSFTNYEIKLMPAISGLVSEATNEPNTVLAWTGLLLLSAKPANILIKHMVIKYKPAILDSNNSNGAGAFIGTLERIIILLLISVNQYSAIGLVLTAKSVARYNKISEDKEFAEYYLLGTLLSALYAIGTYLVLK